MKGSKIPNVVRHELDRSVTMWFQKPRFSLIWMHGMGDEAETYVPFFGHLESPLYQHCRVRLLQAPKRFVTVNQEENHAWFDLKSTNRFNSPEEQVYDLAQLDQTSLSIASHCRQEEQFWREKDPSSAINPQHRVFVGGFSQGAVAALHYALSAETVPAGVIAASGYLLKYTNLLNIGKLPILLMHGGKDTVVGEAAAQTSYARMFNEQTE